MAAVLILRPQPGADETAARARLIGLEPVVAPLFSVAPLAWEAPDAETFDAIMLTSAQAARLAGAELARYRHLPCFAVGEATAAAAAQAGFADIRSGEGDAAMLTALIFADGLRSILHLCGREHVASAPPGLAIERRTVYAADPATALAPQAEQALEAGALALLHSPRAASLFAALAAPRSTIRVAALSAAVAEAAGAGWQLLAVAPRPRDEALLELAAKLCEKAA